MLISFSSWFGAVDYTRFLAHTKIWNFIHSSISICPCRFYFHPACPFITSVPSPAISAKVYFHPRSISTSTASSWLTEYAYQSDNSVHLTTNFCCCNRSNRATFPCVVVRYFSPLCRKLGKFARSRKTLARSPQIPVYFPWIHDSCDPCSHAGLLSKSRPCVPSVQNKGHLTVCHLTCS